MNRELELVFMILGVLYATFKIFDILTYVLNYMIRYNERHSLRKMSDEALMDEEGILISQMNKRISLAKQNLDVSGSSYDKASTHFNECVKLNDKLEKIASVIDERAASDAKEKVKNFIRN